MESYTRPQKQINPFPRNVQVPEHLKPRGTSGTKLLEIERSKASFSSHDMAVYIRGQETLDRQARLLDVIENEEAFDKSRLAYLGRTEKFNYGLRKEKRFVQLSQEKEWTQADMQMAEELIDLPAGFGLHKSMFLETLRSQTTEEQKKLFLEPALKFEIIGCYAQTELGHGSNVQGLETTATYDPETKEFIMHSPSLTASKWWAGGLGRTADHAVVMANLITQGKRRGIIPFLVPIRDPVTRKPLPGRIIGDIGPKIGYNSTDNGMMLLDNVRIPHVNMLARFSQVDPDTGNYIKPKKAQLSYGTMTFIRANIVKNAFVVIARAATVAVRYCAVRRQFTDRDAPQMDERAPAESQVLNYAMVQYRLFPVLVTALAFHFTGRQMYRDYEQNQANLAKGDMSLLAEIHASSCGLKSYATITAAEAIETCRRACAGHGFSSASGLGSQYCDFLPQVTWEGDSYMITQQCARHLFKVFRMIWFQEKGHDTEETVTTDYIRKYIKNVDAKCAVKYSGDFHNPQMLVDAFGHRAAYLIGTAVRKRDIEKRTWNSILVELYRVSMAHSQFLAVKNFADAIVNDEELAANPALHNILQSCFELFACYTMEQNASEFLSSGYLNSKQHELLRNKIDELLASMRPQAVPLVDAFAIPDYLLNSALGRYDGDVYPALVDFASREPLNAIDFNIDVRDDSSVVMNVPMAVSLGLAGDRPNSKL